MSRLERVDVRVCTVLGPEGVEETHTVLCPMQRESKPLVDCEVCDRCVEMRPEQSFITCEVSGDKSSVLVGLARRFVDRLKEVVAIGEVMQKGIVCVTPELGLEAVRALFLDRSIGGAPVVDAEGFPVGVIAKSDLSRPGVIVREVMTATAYTLEETRPLADAITLMVTEQVQRIPIVDQNGRVVGILSSLDLVRWLDG